MKYQKTINLWSGNVQEQIISGKLKLQAGQYVTCGTSDKESKARFVAVRGNSLWVAHPEGKKGTRDSFPRLLQAHKGK